MNKINYLRLSVTDRCNLNCIYCNPSRKEKFLRKEEILSYEEMARIARIFSLLGVDKVRITGGEPLIKREIVKIVRMLKDTASIGEIVRYEITVTNLGNIAVDDVEVMDLMPHGVQYIPGL